MGNEVDSEIDIDLDESDEGIGESIENLQGSGRGGSPRCDASKCEVGDDVRAPRLLSEGVLGG